MCQQGCCAPLLETQRQRDIPFAIPHFPRRCIYKLQNAACNICSENAKRKPAQVRGTDFLLGGNAEERKAFSSAFPQPARRGWKIAMQHALAEAEKNRVVMNFVKQEPTCYRRSKCLMLMILRRGCKKN